jgi:hypothetical protein
LLSAASGATRGNDLMPELSVLLALGLCILGLLTIR